MTAIVFRLGGYIKIDDSTFPGQFTFVSNGATLLSQYAHGGHSINILPKNSLNMRTNARPDVHMDLKSTFTFNFRLNIVHVLY